ncbi:MAG: DUF4861 domain-containing protein, partial [Tannerellaceae bacterium]|nr:DUF4861 domain-containing protein [Tannerellaceae bacterium]
MKQTIYLSLLILCLAACSNRTKTIEVSVSNPSGFDRLADLVEIPLEEIKTRLPIEEGLALEVRSSTGELIPSQLAYDGKLLFQPALKAGESKDFTITTGEPQLYASKTSGRLVTERFDDFAWENDRVAFRLYASALMAKDGPSNGMDALYKRTENPVLDKWFKAYSEDGISYHEDHGEGHDAYDVKRSLGAGAMAPYVKDTLWLNENFIAQEVLENGPLRTTFKLTYKDLNMDGRLVSEERKVSLDAGSQLSEITQIYGTQETLPVAAGIVKREGKDSVIYADDYVIYA